jgi:hypothetical protein
LPSGRDSGAGAGAQKRRSGTPERRSGRPPQRGRQQERGRYLEEGAAADRVDAAAGFAVSPRPSGTLLANGAPKRVLFAAYVGARCAKSPQMRWRRSLVHRRVPGLGEMGRLRVDQVRRRGLLPATRDVVYEGSGRAPVYDDRSRRDVIPRTMRTRPHGDSVITMPDRARTGSCDADR